MEIILLRHGKPDIPISKNINASEFLNWINTYNLAGLCKTSNPTDEVKEVANKCDAVACSSLLRSIDSAKALGISKITLQSSQFNEAEMPTANWAFLKMPPKLWAIFFRVLWLFGYSENSESIKETKLRASKSAKLLIDLADKHGRVLFVGHGVYNRVLAKELVTLGWSGPKNPGSKYWSFGVYGDRNSE